MEFTLSPVWLFCFIGLFGCSVSVFLVVKLKTHAAAGFCHNNKAKNMKKKDLFLRARTEIAPVLLDFFLKSLLIDESFFSQEIFCRRCAQMRDRCHGISSADLLYNRFRDNTSCCPATCSVSREPCHRTQIHGSFTSSQHFKNKHIPINQSKTFRISSNGGSRLHEACTLTQWDGIAGWWGGESREDANVVLKLRPSSLSIILSWRLTVMKCLSWASLACLWKMKPLVARRVEPRRWGGQGLWPREGLSRSSPLLFYTGLNRTIHLNQSAVHAALVPDDFLFTKMTSSSFHE